METEQSLHKSPISYELVKRYYGDPAILQLIASQLNQRELAFIAPKTYDQRANWRFLKANTEQHLRFLLSGTSFIPQELCMNVYRSVGRYIYGIPTVKFLSPERKKEMRAWCGRHTSFMEAYDYVIDIDNSEEDFSFCYDSMVNITSFYDSYDVPYYLTYSGDGYHITVPYEAFRPYIKREATQFIVKEGKEDIFYHFQALTKELRERYSEMIDLNIYDPRRLIKVPYTLVFYEKEAYICTPLNNESKHLDKPQFRYDENTIVSFEDTPYLFNPKGDARHLVEMIKKLGGRDIWQ